MSGYIPNTDVDRQKMLAEVGVNSMDELFEEIPAELRSPRLNLPAPLSELELTHEMEALAQRNLNLASHTSFLGAGAYGHYIPSVVYYVIGRSEFYTSYTPYQAEVSQGTLQTMFEYQSLVAKLTGMDVANSSMYDGATAFAEAALMAVRLTHRPRVAVSASVHPQYRAVLRTYVAAQAVGLTEFEPNNLPDITDCACLMVQSPDFFGRIVRQGELAEAAHSAGALLVVAVNPISLGLLKSPGEYGADIVVGEGQPLGNSLSFGGPYLGLFACRAEHMRQMPGRVVGMATDAKGRVGYVLTLQTREQHIRRERATSNICTNEALNALAASAYLVSLGPEGLRRVAELCYQKAHYAAKAIAEIPGFILFSEDPFFHEFVIQCPFSPAEINRGLLKEGVVGGLDVSADVENGWLVCVTEVVSRGEIDRLVCLLTAMSQTKPGSRH